MAGLYIHIPFCASRCIYCGFYSTTQLSMQDKYVDAICRELALRKDYINESINTIYLGGGTPSQLTIENLQKLFVQINNVYTFNPKETEITIECNPDDVTSDYLSLLKSIGINRVSMGVQTFNDERLAFLHRRHTSHEAFQAIDMIRNAGIDNISIDLMFGFPSETMEEWQYDLQQAVTVDVNHISAYSLMYEKGTTLYNLLHQGKVREIDEELSVKMYDSLIDTLKSAGYEHYEISNFAKHGFRSRHNSSYWHSIPYIGVGAAAHSFDICSRQWNVADINKYIEGINNGIIPMEREILSDNMKYNDLVTTSMRISDGIDISKLQPKYKTYILNNARHFINEGLLDLSDDNIVLTRKGIPVSDMIMSELMYIE